jgi:predicted ATPase/DNA-binding SARP family transcriptional activator
MAHLQVYLFGAPRIERAGVPVAAERRKALALLAYLAATRQPHGRDALAALLWPELDQQRARAALRRTLFSLNEALGKGCIQTEGDCLALSGALYAAVDVDHFRALLAKAAAHDHRPFRLCDDCLADLTRAAELYRGDFLAGFTLEDTAEFDDWQAYQSEELRRGLAGGLEKLALGHAGRREYDVALRHARRWLALDPLSEPAHRLIMRLYTWAGDRAAAARQYEECVRLLAEELGIEPEPETRALYEELLQLGRGRERGPEQPDVAMGEQALAPPPLTVQELPPDPTPFLGRETELAQIAARLADPACRLLTLTGPGGIGKTRLAIQAGRMQVERFTDGVAFADLAPLASPDFLPAAILEGLGASARDPTDPERQLIGYLRGKHLLLVLDNFEHLMDGVALLPKVLRAAPQVKLLVTSRARLNLREEWLSPLGGLELPPGAAPTSLRVYDEGRSAELVRPEAASGAQPDLSLEAYGATALFLTTLQRLLPGYRPAGADARQIVRICRLLEGMPLAIELAAAWARTLSLREIAGELKRSLHLLATTLRDVPARHRSMTAAFDHSWRLLSPREQGILRPLSVFRGGFTREAAGAITGASLADLTGLADASWLRLGPAGRYELHELVRQYCEAKLAGEQLAESGESAGQVRDRHSQYFASFGQAHEPGFWHSPEVMQEVAPEVDNLLAAWDWAVGQADTGTLTRLSPTLFNYGYLLAPSLATVVEVFEGARRKLRDALLAAGDDRDREQELAACLARILYYQGELRLDQGLSEQTETCAEEGLALLPASCEAPEEGRQDQDRQQTRVMLTVLLASAINHQGDAIRSTDLLQALLSDPRPAEIGPLSWIGGPESHWLGQVYRALAYSFMATGQYEASQQFTEKAIAQFEKDGAGYMVAVAKYQLSALAYMIGDYPRAEAAAREAEQFGRAFGDRTGAVWGWLGWVWLGLGRLEAAAGRYPQARAYCRRSVALYRRNGKLSTLTFALQESGAVELAAGNPAEAQRLYLESVEVMDRIGQSRFLARGTSLVGLGRVALAGRNLAAATAHFRQVLVTGNGWAWDTADAAIGMAQVYAGEGQLARAVELLAFAESWPPTMHVPKERARKLLEELEAEMPAEVFAAASARGRSRQVEDVVAELTS